MNFEQSQRALDFMLCALPEQRRCSRVHLPIQAVAVFPDFGLEQQTALLRDVNMLGAFFYCKHRPSVGDNVRLNFALADQGEPIEVSCEGLVVRTEEFTPGAAIGVATTFTRYEIVRPQKLGQLPLQLENASFLRWTVEMVERIFEKSGRLAGPVCECEPAA